MVHPNRLPEGLGILTLEEFLESCGELVLLMLLPNRKMCIQSLKAVVVLVVLTIQTCLVDRRELDPTTMFPAGQPMSSKRSLKELLDSGRQCVTLV